MTETTAPVSGVPAEKQPPEIFELRGTAGTRHAYQS